MKGHFAFCRVSTAPITGRLMSFVMTRVPYGHPTSAARHFHKRHLDKKLQLTHFLRLLDTVISAVNSNEIVTSY